MKIWQKVLISLGAALLIGGILYQMIPEPFCRIPGISSEEAKADSFFFPRDHKRPTIIHFWSSWCPPCLKELAEVNEFMSQYPDAPLMLVAEDQEPVEEIKGLFERKGWTALKSEVDSHGKWAQKYSIKGLPVTVFVDDNQQELARVEGPMQWKDKTLQEVLQMAQPKA